MIRKAIAFLEDNDLFARLSRNVAAFGFSQISNLVVQLLQPTLFLSYWGVSRYGEWIVLSGIPSALSLLDAGVTGASANKATLLAGKGEWEGCRNTLQTARVYTTLISIIAVIGSIVFTKYWDVTELFKIHSISKIEGSIVFILLAVGSSINLHNGYVDAWARAIGFAYLTPVVAGSWFLLNLLTTYIILHSKSGIMAVAIGNVFIALIVRVTFSMWTKKNAPTYLKSFGKFSWIELKSIFIPSVSYLGFPLTQILTIQGGVQILNQFSSNKTVVAFTMTRTLVRLVLQIGIVFNYSLKPEISRLLGKGKISDALHLTKKTTVFTSLFSLICYLMLIIIGPWIITFWSHGNIHQGSATIALIGLHAIINTLWFIPAAYLIACNKHTILACIYSLTALFVFIIWAYLGKRINPIYGAVSLLTVPEVFMISYMVSRYALLKK